MQEEKKPLPAATKKKKKKQAPPVNHYKQALLLLDMSEKLYLKEFRKTYYDQALEHLGRCHPEKHADLLELTEEVSAMRNQAIAEELAEGLARAEELEKEAQTAAQYEAAGRKYGELAQIARENPFDREKTDSGTKELLKDLDDLEEKAEACRKKSRALAARSNRTSWCIAFLVVVVILAGLWSFRTSTVQILLGKGAGLIGLDAQAAVCYDNAWKRHHNDQTRQLYYASVCKAAQKQYQSGEYEEALETLKTAVDDRYEDAVTLAEKIEQAELEAAIVGDPVTFAGMRWIVLNEEEGTLTLIRAKEGNFGPFQLPDGSKVCWENSDLRSRLNADYLEEHFSDGEKEMLQEQAGDLVRILTSDELLSLRELMAEAEENCWLMDNGSGEGNICFATPDNEVMTEGYDAAAEGFYAKPVITVRTASGQQQTEE